MRKEVEDILLRIENIEGFLNRRFSEFEPYGRKMDLLTTYTFLILKVLGVVLGLVLVVYFVPRLINMGRVMFVQETPSFEEYSDAYDLWFALTRPWIKGSERSRMIQIKVGSNNPLPQTILMFLTLFLFSINVSSAISKYPDMRLLALSRKGRAKWCFPYFFYLFILMF